ncbi:MAG TPA: hypothetical protein VN749_16430 [Candidatus Eisenbacteria bacterium]|jgi:hypothetical protein|nr:hypothetical protein [Candidatus Limnocylindrales bacterium]HXT26405.1 hypothetical protein [Candidatus Eisenbacteria bacterium]
MPVSTGVSYELATDQTAGLVPEGGPAKLFESTDIAECVRMEPALMRAKPRCGHVVTFSKSKKAGWLFFEMAGSSNLLNHQLHHRQQIIRAD